MTEPHVFHFLNLDITSVTVADYARDVRKNLEDQLYKYTFDIGMAIKVEKRAVISFPQVFGDLGGLYEFLSTLAIYIVGRYQSKSFSLQHVSQHFQQLKPGGKSFSKI